MRFSETVIALPGVDVKPTMMKLPKVAVYVEPANVPTSQKLP